MAERKITGLAVHMAEIAQRQRRRRRLITGWAWIAFSIALFALTLWQIL